MSLRFNVSCMIAVVVLGPLQLAADSFQYPLPFNVDVIREPGGSAGGIGFSGGTSGPALVTQSYATANDPLTPHGLPDNGIVKGVQLGPYNGKNAVSLGTNSGTLLQGAPPYFFVLHVYAVADEGLGTSIKLSINKSHTVLYDQQSISNWLNGGGLIGGMDTTGPGGSGFVDLNRAGISDVSFFVDNRDLSINSIFVQNVPVPFAPGGNLYVLGVAATFPEPGSIALLGLTALLPGRRRR